PVRIFSRMRAVSCTVIVRARGSLMRRNTSVSAADSPAERVSWVEVQPRLASHEGIPGDRRHDDALRPIEPAITRFEAATDHTLLDPWLLLRELPIHCEACNLRARARTARGTVVCLAGAEHEVAAAGLWRGRRSENLHVIHLRVALRVGG